MPYLSLGERLVIPTYDNEEYTTTGRVEVDTERCNGCGVCALICPGKAIEIDGHGKSGKARLVRENPQCMSCNDCAAICERDAISVSLPYDFSYRFKKLNRGEFLPPRRFPG